MAAAPPAPRKRLRALPPPLAVRVLDPLALRALIFAVVEAAPAGASLECIAHALFGAVCSLDEGIGSAVALGRAAGEMASFVRLRGEAAAAGAAAARLADQPPGGARVTLVVHPPAGLPPERLDAYAAALVAAALHCKLTFR